MNITRFTPEYRRITGIIKTSNTSDIGTVFVNSQSQLDSTILVNILCYIPADGEITSITYSTEIASRFSGCYTHPWSINIDITYSTKGQQACDLWSVDIIIKGKQLLRVVEVAVNTQQEYSTGNKRGATSVPKDALSPEGE